MKRTMESLAFTEYSNSTATFSREPAPKTLVMNGDLAAYFPKREWAKYKNIYYNAQALTE